MQPSVSVLEGVASTLRRCYATARTCDTSLLNYLASTADSKFYPQCLVPTSNQQTQAKGQMFTSIEAGVGICKGY